MPRKLLVLAAAALVLLGAWWMYRGSEPTAEVDPLAVELATPVDDGRAEQVPESAALRAPDVETKREIVGGAVATQAGAKATLVVVCQSRIDQRPMEDVRVRVVEVRDAPSDPGGGSASRAVFDDTQTTAHAGRVDFVVPAGTALRITAGGADRQLQMVVSEVPALEPLESRSLRLALEDGELIHLCGLVVARDTGAPVVDAAVAVEGSLCTRTDANGRFQLDFSSRSPPWLRVDAAGFAPVVTGAARGHEMPQNARRIELPRAAALEIALRHSGDRSALRVELHGAGYDLLQDGLFTTEWHTLPELDYAAPADASGVCRFAALPPGVHFGAQVRGPDGVVHRRAEPIVLQPGARERMEWDLHGAEIIGHVYDADGRPAASVALWLMHSDPDNLRYVEEWQRKEDLVGLATSAGDGSFRLQNVAAGTWQLSPAPDGLIAAFPQVVQVAPAATRVVVDVRLSRGNFVRGRLVAPDGTTGVQGFVTIEGPVHANTNTNAEGVFVLGPLVPGKLRLVGAPHSTHRESEPVEVEPPAADVLLISQPGAEVSGQVVDAAGQGVQSAITVASSEGRTTMTRTQSDGTFRLDGLAPGACTLFACTADGRAGLLTAVALEPGIPVANQRVVLSPGSTLRVRYDGRGTCSFRFVHGGVTFSGDSLWSGESLSQVVPPGRVVVEHRIPGSEREERVELELAPGETRDVVLREPAPK